MIVCQLVYLQTSHVIRWHFKSPVTQLASVTSNHVTIMKSFAWLNHSIRLWWERPAHSVNGFVPTNPSTLAFAFVLAVIWSGRRRTALPRRWTNWQSRTAYSRRSRPLAGLRHAPRREGIQQLLTIKRFRFNNNSNKAARYYDSIGRDRPKSRLFRFLFSFRVFFSTPPLTGGHLSTIIEGKKEH